MPMVDLPILQALKVKMKWHQGRQQLLALNVANADTPDYQARDFKQPTFKQLLEPQKPAGLAPVRTSSAHLAGHPLSAGGGFDRNRNVDFEVTPEGNAVVLEEEMMKVTQNQMDYQMATTLYSRGLGLLRTAIGRRG